MGLPALALRHVERHPVGLYIQPPELPIKKDAPVKEPSESPLINLEIDEPFGGWQIFEKPVPEGNGNYSIKLGQKNLSTLNDNNKFARLQYELNSISSPSVKHLIIDFVHCYNDPYDISRTGDIADFLTERREDFVKSGKVLSLAHLEGHLYHDTDLKSIDAFVHKNIEDAIRNNNNHNELPPKETFVFPQPYLRIASPDADPAASEISGNYLG